MKSGIFLSLGSNRGDRGKNLTKASAELEFGDCAIKRRSAIYETAPWGEKDQQDFYNQVVELSTNMEPGALLERVLDIEARLGRIRKEKWGPRIIDIDILFFRDTILKSASLIVPHPGIAMRKFVLVPLAELAPDMIHPLLNKSVAALLEECEDPLEVRKIS